MDNRADTAGERFMKLMQAMGFVSLCSYSDPEGPFGECATEIIADPSDAELVQIMLSMLVADYAEICNWSKEETIDFLMCVASDAMSERFGDELWEDIEDDMQEGRVVARPGRPTLRVLPGRKQNDTSKNDKK